MFHSDFALLVVTQNKYQETLTKFKKYANFFSSRGTPMEQYLTGGRRGTQ